MASLDVVSQIQHQRLAEAEEERLGRSATAAEVATVGRLRLRLGLWLIRAGQLLATGTPNRHRAAWAAPSSRATVSGPARRR